LVEIVKTSDGSHTLFVPELNEHYHSVCGALRESETVFIRNGYDYCSREELNILEIGFGTGLNTLLTLLRSLSEKRKVRYTAIEKYPLTDEITAQLNHGTVAGSGGVMLFKLIHSCQWGEEVKINADFTLLKINEDILEYRPAGIYDLIYFDAFGPDKQPELWSREIFRKISDVTTPGGILVTYSCKGAVKRALRESGFSVHLLPGPPGKREVTRAVKIS
jgi:tRNA U34 5-methylaminomethyl-2-thiouridine-forming methyltransferase MnmC